MKNNNMKRKLFIGSSSEGLKIARQVRDIITDQCGDWLDCIIWDEGKVFSFNKSFLDSLVRASRKYDYGILVATANDIVQSRNSTKKVPRDNVIFELGLFLGSLGLKRAFIFTDSKSILPSDFNGIAIPKFSSKKITSKDLNNLMEILNSTKNSYSLKIIPSAALALSYFDNFILNFAQRRYEDNVNLKIFIPLVLDDLSRQIFDYSLKNPSVEVSVLDDGSRPIVHRYTAESNSFWDIPTTLTTLRKLIDFVHHSDEIGISLEKNEWIEYELKNFKGSLEVLISESYTCKNKVSVHWL